MKVSVDQSRCILSGTCTDIAPEVFAIGDDGQLQVLQEEPGDELRSQVDDAADMCPTRAITIQD